MKIWTCIAKFCTVWMNAGLTRDWVNAWLRVSSLLFRDNVAVIYLPEFPCHLTCDFLITSNLLLLLLQLKKHFISSVPCKSGRFRIYLSIFVDLTVLSPRRVFAVIRTVAVLTTKTFPRDHQVALEPKCKF